MSERAMPSRDAQAPTACRPGTAEVDSALAETVAELKKTLDSEGSGAVEFDPCELDALLEGLEEAPGAPPPSETGTGWIHVGQLASLDV